MLKAYPWPGNVRELRNVLERAELLAPQPVIDASALRELLPAPGADRAVSAFKLPTEGVSLEELERLLIRQALERVGGNRTRAAALLGLSRDTLRYRLEKCGIE